MYIAPTIQNPHALPMKDCRQDYNHHDDSKQSDCFLYNVEAEIFAF